MTPAQAKALDDLRADARWKVLTLTSSMMGRVLTVVRLDRRRGVSRITNLNIHPDGRVQITAGPVPTTRRKSMKAPAYEA